MGSNCPTSSDGNAMTMREGLASSSHRLRDRMRRRSENGIRLAAVAQDRFAGGEGRPLRTEEQAQRGHLLWLARPSDRNVLHHVSPDIVEAHMRLRLLVRPGTVAFRVDIACAVGVDGNALICDLARHGFRKPRRYY